METIRELQAYGYFFLTAFLVIVLYGYIFHLYRSEKSGRRNYEKYGNIALSDNIGDTPVESISATTQSAKNKEEQ